MNKTTRDDLRFLAQDQRFINAIAAIIGAPVMYWFYRRMGAPRWAALALTENALRVWEIKNEVKLLHAAIEPPRRAR